MRELCVAKSAGFCFGVSRSVKMAEEMLAAEANCYSLGELIHNDDVVQHLPKGQAHPRDRGGGLR